MAARTVDTEQLRELLDAGAQVIEVLPADQWRKERLPGARSIPLPELRAETVTGLDPARPTVTYCYDHECDLSARAAARLRVLGFSDVYDYAASKTAWLGAGLPTEGDVRSEDRAGSLARPAPTCAPGATIADVAEVLRDPGTTVVLVVDPGGVVLGALHPQAAALPPATPVLVAADPGPASVRPSITRFELAASMAEAGQHHVVVSTSAGELLGVVTRQDLG